MKTGYMHKICVALACALGTASAAELNFYTQGAEEICAADWHSRLARQLALCTLATIRCVPPGQNLTEEERVKKKVPAEPRSDKEFI